MTAHDFTRDQLAHYNALAWSTPMAAFIDKHMPADPPASLVEALMDALDTTEATELERAIYRVAIGQAFDQVNAAKARLLSKYLEGKKA